MTDRDDISTEEIVRRYYAVLQSGEGAFDPDRLRAILASDLAFEGPLAGARVGVEPFIKGVFGFVQSARRLDFLQELYVGGQASTLYDAEFPGGSVRFAEFFQARNGTIVSLRLLYDATQYRALGGR